MSKFNSSKPVQLISGVGEFNTGVGSEVSFGNDTGHVGVVSIMGVQSSGKSTLMNKCFSTDFKEMNEEEGMTQTTKGIWISKVSFSDANDTHNILLLDCEGSDGSEREKEDSEVFEKQVTLFALASSDVVLINMKCDNVNLHNGAGMPLIRSVFEVMVRMFNTPRRITLLFVLRDKNKVPLEKLKNKLKTQLDEVWNRVCEGSTNPLVFDHSFQVEVVALSHYEHKEEAFMKEVAELREKIFDMVKKGKLSQAANFMSFTKKNWMDIQKDKVLNLQLNKDSADEEFFRITREEIARKFRQDEDWIKMQKSVRKNVETDFGGFVRFRIKNCLSEFDKETQSFNKKSTDDSRAQLTARLFEITVEDTYLSFLENEKKRVLKSFEKDVARNIKASNDVVNIDQRPYIKAFEQILSDARIIQDDISNQKFEVSEIEDLISRMAQHVESVLYKLRERKRLENSLKTKKKVVFVSGGAVVVATIISICLMASNVVVPGAATLVAAAAGGLAVVEKYLDFYKKVYELKDFADEIEEKLN